MNFHPEGFVFSAAVYAGFVNWDFRRLLKNVSILSLTGGNVRVDISKLYVYCKYLNVFI